DEVQRPAGLAADRIAGDRNGRENHDGVSSGKRDGGGEKILHSRGALCVCDGCQSPTPAHRHQTSVVVAWLVSQGLPFSGAAKNCCPSIVRKRQPRLSVTISTAPALRV